MDVITALRNSNKGRLNYDRYWVSEGRTKEVLDNIAARLTEINISPKALACIQSTSPVEMEVEICINETTASLTPKLNVKDVKESYYPPDTHFFQLQSEMEVPLLEYEECRLKSVQDIFESKKKEYKSHSEEIEQQIDQQYHLLKRKNELGEKRKAVAFQKAQEEYFQKVKEKEMLQKEHYQTQAKKLSAKVKEAELKQKKAEEEIRKREQEQQELLIQLDNCQKEAENLISKSMEKLNYCEHQNYLNIPTSERNRQLSDMLQNITSFVNQIKTDIITIDDIINANYLVKQSYEALQEILNDIEQAKLKVQNEREKVQLKQSMVREALLANKGLFKSDVSKSLAAGDSENVALEMLKRQTPENSPETSNKDDITVMEENTEIAEEKTLLSSFIASDAVQDFVKIKETFKNFEILIQPFIDDVKNKKCRFELQKKVNSPINKIFSGSKSHVKSQINQLLALLSGKTVEINRRNVPFNEDSLIFNYTLNIVAKQLVTHGEVEIASHSAYAFPFAAAVAAVWAKHPNVCPLLLGHFYTKCPYLVPYYPPRQEDQSEDDFYKSMGYKSATEDLTSFLKRMCGFVRLYAAIIISPLPSDSKATHPHGLSCGWKWLSRILNMDPRPHVTATLIYEFLYIAGYSLQQAYGKQFKKLLHVLCKDYFIKIKSVTDTAETKTPVERLEQFLQLTIKKGCISPPEGILASDFWIR